MFAFFSSAVRFLTMSSRCSLYSLFPSVSLRWRRARFNSVSIFSRSSGLVIARTKDISDKNKQLNELYKELESNFNDFIRTFIGALEIYSPVFGNHSKRVSIISRLVAKKLKLDIITSKY